MEPLRRRSRMKDVQRKLDLSLEEIDSPHAELGVKFHHRLDRESLEIYFVLHGKGVLLSGRHCLKETFSMDVHVE